MSVREFNKVGHALWRSARFAGLSDRGKIAFLYFITNSHINSAGVYALPDGYACADLGWDLATFHEIRAEIIAAGMLDMDTYHGEVLVERWFKHNPPMNDKHAKGTAKFIASVESDRLREKAEEALFEVEQFRLAKQAEKQAEAEAKEAEKPVPHNGNVDRLLNTRLMQEGR